MKKNRQYHITVRMTKDELDELNLICKHHLRSQSFMVKAMMRHWTLSGDTGNKTQERRQKVS